jgi:predicted transposase YbfD/YdcC
LEQDIIAHSEENNFIDYHCVKEVDRGSTKWWDVDVYEVKNQTLKEKWVGLKRYVVVKKTEMKQGVFCSYKRYFITDSTQLSAQEFANGIRKHWHIENKLHRTRDVFFNQDKNKIATISGALNIATMNTIAINWLTKIDKSVIVAQMTVAVNYQELLMKWRT